MILAFFLHRSTPLAKYQTPSFKNCFCICTSSDIEDCYYLHSAKLFASATLSTSLFRLDAVKIVVILAFFLHRSTTVGKVSNTIFQEFFCICTSSDIEDCYYLHSAKLFASATLSTSLFRLDTVKIVVILAFFLHRSTTVGKVSNTISQKLLLHLHQLRY